MRDILPRPAQTQALARRAQFRDGVPHALDKGTA
jgi:hypothetical protein